MAVSFVAATTAVFAADDTISGNAPSGLADGDCLLAAVFGRGTLANTTGWTKIEETAQFTEGSTDFPQRLAVYRKDTVTAGNSGASYTFTVSSSESFSPRMGLAYIAFRGVDSIPQTVDNITSNVNTWSITPSTATADADGSMLAAFAASCYASASAITPTAPTSFTLTSGSSLTGYRLAAAYRAVNNAQSNSGAFNMAPSVANPATSVGENNGLGAIVIRMAPASVPNNNTWVEVPTPLGSPALFAAAGAFVAVPSPLGAPSLAAAVDFHDQIEGMPVYAFVDLVMEDDSLVRIPVGSWNATIQLDDKCYMRCSVPAPTSQQIDDIGAAVEFIVTIQTFTRAGGNAVTKEIGRAPVQTVQSDQGGTNHSLQISGYFDAYPALAEQVEAFYRPQRGVRLVSTQPNTVRVRASYDWIVVPGNVATFSDGAGQLEVAYINWYGQDGDRYIDIGSRQV